MKDSTLLLLLFQLRTLEMVATRNLKWSTRSFVSVDAKRFHRASGESQAPSHSTFCSRLMSLSHTRWWALFQQCSLIVVLDKTFDPGIVGKLQFERIRGGRRHSCCRRNSTGQEERETGRNIEVHLPWAPDAGHWLWETFCWGKNHFKTRNTIETVSQTYQQNTGAHCDGCWTSSGETRVWFSSFVVAEEEVWIHVKSFSEV